MDNENYDVNEENQTEPVNEEPVELTELFVQKKKTVTLSDTITLQAILCVVISIIYIGINMLFPQIAAEMYDIYEYNANSEMNDYPAADVFKSVAEFMDSKPVEYD